MKKKLFLLAVAVIAFCFILAIGASAETVTYGEDEITVTRWFTASELLDGTAKIGETSITIDSFASKLGNSGLMDDQKAILDDNSIVILADSNGKLHAFPSYYVFNLSNAADADTYKYIAVSEMSYDFVNAYSTGVTFSKGAVRYIEFPEGMTVMRNNGVYGKGSGYESNVTEIVIPSTTVLIEAKSFEGLKKLTAFKIRENSALKTIGDDAFCDCAILKNADLSNAASLETLGGWAFQRCYELETVTLPNSLKTIGTKTFDACTKMQFTSSYLPSSLTYIGEYFLSSCKNINETIIFPEGITSISKEAFNGASRPDGKGNLNLVFLGKMTDVVINGSCEKGYASWAEQVNLYFAQNTLSDYNGNVYAFKNASDGTLDSFTAQSGTLLVDPSDSSPYSSTQVGDNFMALIFCGNNGSVEISYMLSTDGKSITADRKNYDMSAHSHITAAIPTCASSSDCIICDVAQTVEHTKGDLVGIDYYNGFAAAGNKLYDCTVCEETVIEKDSAVAILKALGYSTKGTDGISGGFIVNTSALKEYNALYPDKPVRFGIVIMNAKYQNDTSVESFFTNGVLTQTKGAIQIEITSSDYATFNYMISGFSGDYADMEMIIAAYAYTDSNNVELIQKDYTNESKSPVKTSYTKTDGKAYSVTLATVTSPTSSDSEEDNKETTVTPNKVISFPKVHI